MQLSTKLIFVCLIDTCIQNKVISCSNILFLTQHLAYIIIHSIEEKKRICPGRLCMDVIVTYCSGRMILDFYIRSLFSFFSLSLASRSIESIKQYRQIHTYNKIQTQTFQQTKNKNTSSYDRLLMWRPNNNIE